MQAVKKETDERPRFVVITNGNFFARVALEDFFREHANDIDRVVVITGDYCGRTGIRAIRALAKTTAFPYLVYKIFSILLFSAAAACWRNATFLVEGLAKRYGLPLFCFPSIDDPAAVDCIAAAQADLIVSVSCPQRVRADVLRSARAGGINAHVSLLPAYAGLAPYFWVLAEGEQKSGTTVHFMVDRFDAGPILCQEEMAIERGESAFSLFRRLVTSTSPLLVRAARMALAGEPGRPQALDRGSYCSHPSFAAYRALRRHGHRLVRTSEVLQAIAATVRTR